MLGNPITNAITWLLTVQDKTVQDGSWHEIDTNESDEVRLLNQKIVYTSQVLRAFAAIGLNTEVQAISKGLEFLLNAQRRGDGLYDHALRFFAFHNFDKVEEAGHIAHLIAGEQRKHGYWEWRRHHNLWFGPLFGLEILAIFYPEKYSTEVERSKNLLLKNKDNADWDDSPSITSWALRLLKKTSKQNVFPDGSSETIEWLRDKRVGNLWRLDFEPNANTITPEIACDLNTTCHVLINLSEFTELMNSDVRRDCITAPLVWVTRQFKQEGFCIGKTKPDPYITALAIRCLITAQAENVRSTKEMKKNKSLWDIYQEALEGKAREKK